MQRRVEVKQAASARTLDALVIVLSYLAVLLVRAAVVAWWPFDLIPSGEKVLQQASWLTSMNLLVLFLPAWIFGLQVAGSYERLPRLKMSTLLFRVSCGAVIGALSSLSILFLMKQTAQVSRTVFVGFAVMSVITLFIGRLYMARYHRGQVSKGIDTRNVIVAAITGTGRHLVETLERHSDLGIRIVGIVRRDEGDAGGSSAPVLGNLQDLPRILEEQPVDQVYATGRTWDVEELRRIADTCEEVGVQFSIDANFLGLKTARAELEDIDGNAILSFSTTPRNLEALVMKRFLDVALSMVAMVFLSPVFLFTALAIKLEDPKGPAIFGQERCGLNGRKFTMWKFRSMVVDAEEQQDQLFESNEVDGPVFKITKDPRITRVGSLLRKMSIDELPQFWNVLQGDMSMVGPRPPIPDEVKEYERWQMRRLSMKPGLTCLWQVGGRNSIDFRTWMELDLEYIDNWSLLLDLKLLLKTPKAILTGTGK